MIAWLREKWWTSRFHKHKYRYRECTLPVHNLMGKWMHQLFKELAAYPHRHDYGASCDDAWVCVCGKHMDSDKRDMPLPVARLVK